MAVNRKKRDMETPPLDGNTFGTADVHPDGAGVHPSATFTQMLDAGDLWRRPSF